MICLKSTDYRQFTIQDPGRLFRADDVVGTEALAVGMAGITSHKLVLIHSNIANINEGERATIDTIYLTDDSSL